MSKEKVFIYDGYAIPEKLVMLTGGGTDDWEDINKAHLESYRKYTPIDKDAVVMEVGCGVGRDAIELTKILSDKGRYIGFDIIKPSIEWCQKNITKRHKNFKFYHYDIKSQIHNSEGSLSTRAVKLPAKDGSVDRIILNSVFTHMFEKDILHYLKEFNRILKPDGLVLATIFIMDDKAQKSLAAGKALKMRHPLSFQHKFGSNCYINDENYPEGAVAYTPKKIQQMLLKSRMGLHGRYAHRGAWSGLQASNAQDVLILEKVPYADALINYTRPMQFTTR